jgi:hypothetical protein
MDTIRAHSRFLDLKRELYGKFLATSDAIMEQLNDRRLAPDGPLKDWRSELAELAILLPNIELVTSDEMTAMVSSASDALSSAYYGVDRHYGDELVGQANDALAHLRHAMRRDVYRDLQAGRKSVDLESQTWSGAT